MTESIEVLQERVIYEKTELIRHGDKMTIRTRSEEMPIRPDQQNAYYEKIIKAAQQMGSPSIRQDKAS